jgi:hypothetical protein
MKNAFSILTLLTLLLFTACKKDEAKSADNELVGDWKFTAFSCPDGEQSGSTILGSFTQMFTIEGSDFDRTVSFNADGTYTSSGGFKAIMTQTVDGIEQSLETDLADAMLTGGTYEIDGNLMTFTSNGESGTAEITINGNQLEVKQVVDRTDVVTQNGVTFSTSTFGTFTSNLEKQ